MNLRVAVGGRVIDISADFPYPTSPVGYRVLLPSGSTGIVVGVSSQGVPMEVSFPDAKPVVFPFHLDAIKDLSKLYGMLPWRLLFFLLPNALLWREETYLVATDKSTDFLDKRSSEVINYVKTRGGVKEENLKERFDWRLVELLKEKGFLKEEKRWKAPEEEISAISLNTTFEEAYKLIKKLKLKTKEEKLSLIAYLKDRPFVLLEELKEQGFSTREINYLLRKGILKKEAKLKSYPKRDSFILPEVFVRKLKTNTIIWGSYTYGVERLKELVATTLAKGGSSLVICPNLSVLFSLERELRDLLGDELLLISSEVGSSAVFKNWFKAQEGKKVVLGSSLALLAPIRGLELIILFDDLGVKLHNRIDIRNYLYLLSKYSGAKFVSVLPSLDVATYHFITLQSLEEEHQTSDAEVLIFERKHNEVISKEVAEFIEDKIDKQILFLVNKEGYGYAYCPRCEFLCMCPVCHTFLTLSKEKERLYCTSCGFKSPLVCPECGGKVESSSFGIERVIEEVEKLWGIKENFTFSTYPSFSKSYHLVLVLNADNLLSVPFFNAEEKYYKYLWRALSITKEYFVIQSMLVDNPILTELKNKDWRSFLEREVKVREEEELPPFSRLIRARFVREKEKALKRLASRYNTRIRSVGELIEVLVKIKPREMGEALREINKLFPITIEIL